MVDPAALASAAGIAGSFLTQLFSSTRAKLPIHGRVFETVSRPLGCHWHPETTDRPSDLCGQCAGRWPTTTHDRRQRRIDSVGVSTTTPFEANFQNPDPQGGAAQRIVPAEE